MNLKEYNYCKRHHPYALSRYLNIKTNRITSYDPGAMIQVHICINQMLFITI